MITWKACLRAIRLAPAIGLAVGLTTAVSAPAEARLTVRRVVVRGKAKTLPAVLSDRMHLHPGDPVDQEALREAQQRLIENDVYRSAKVFIDMPKELMVRRMYLDDRDYPVDIQVEVVEKVSQFAVPIASLGSGDWAGGFIFVDQNLFGHGTQLLTTAQIGTSKSFVQIGYRNPLVSWAPLTWSVNGLYRYEQIRFFESHKLVMEVPTIVTGGEAQVGWVLSPHLQAMLGFWARHQAVRQADVKDDEAGRPPYNPRSGRILVASFQFQFDNTSAPEGLRRGVRLNLKNETSDAWWGSDFDYSKFEARAELYGHYKRNYPSVLLRVALNYPTSDHGVPITELLRVGGPTLRGYLLNEFHGDTLLSAQVEDQIVVYRNARVPWTDTHFNVAAAAFVDSAALLQRHPGGTDVQSPGATRVGPRFSDFHTSVGAGARIILPGIAIPAIRLDVGYGIDVRSFAATLSIAGGGG